MRLYLRDAIDEIDQRLEALQNAILGLAEKESATIMPGFYSLTSGAGNYFRTPHVGLV